MKLVASSELLSLYHGDAADWDRQESVDMIITTPQSPLPESLRGLPMLLHMGYHHWNYTERMEQLKRWAYGYDIPRPIVSWNRGREQFFAFNVPGKLEYMDLDSYLPTKEGWWPEPMIQAIVEAFVPIDVTIWDGYMGRGTLGKVCHSLGLGYVGIDKSLETVQTAITYLGLQEDMV